MPEVAAPQMTIAKEASANVPTDTGMHFANLMICETILGNAHLVKKVKEVVQVVVVIVCSPVKNRNQVVKNEPDDG